MPTLAELQLALTTVQPPARDEMQEIALHILRFNQRAREAQILPDLRRTDFRAN